MKLLNTDFTDAAADNPGGVLGEVKIATGINFGVPVFKGDQYTV